MKALKKYRWPLTGALLGVLVFLAVYGVRVLDPTSVDWILNSLSPDPIQHYLGWELFRRSPVHLPYIGANYNAVYPFRTSVLFTDSLPLAALFFKLLGGILPTRFQYFGWWGLLCYALQGGLAQAVIARIAGVQPTFGRDDKSKAAIAIIMSPGQTAKLWGSVLGAGVLVLFPALTIRMFAHTALAANWLVLLALYLWLRSDELMPTTRRACLIWGGMGLLCAGIHLYYLPMVGLVLVGYAVRRALHYEIRRQAEELDMGIPQIQSTRRWDDERGESVVMRTKEDAHDYRYFPCPDLVPVRTAPLVEKVRGQIPELPQERQKRFMEEYGLSEYDANVLVGDLELARFFEEAARGTASGKKIANWVINNISAVLNEKGMRPSECPVKPGAIRELIAIIDDGTVSNNQAKDVFAKMWDEPALAAAQAAKLLGFEKADSSFLDGIVREVISANPDKVAEIQGGNEKLLNWLTGQVMKAAKGKANPKIVTEALKKALSME